MDEEHIKKENSSHNDKETAPEEQVFLETPMKVEYNLDNYEYKDNSNVDNCGILPKASSRANDGGINKVSDEQPKLIHGRQLNSTEPTLNYSNGSQLSRPVRLIHGSLRVKEKAAGPTGGFQGGVQTVTATERDWLDPAKWPTKRSCSFVDTIVTIGPGKIEDIEFPADRRKRHFSLTVTERRLKNGEKIKRRWLVYSKSKDRAYCFCCKIFRSGTPNLSSCGTNDWKHLYENLKSHEKSTVHMLAYCEWTEAESRLKLNKKVSADHQRIIKEETRHWRDFIERLVEITVFLAENKLPFRGSSDKFFTPDNGIFLGLVQVVGKFDNVLGEHLRRALSDHYCNETIQNELLDLLAGNVIARNLTGLKTAKYFSVILDCTTDISHSEKMSVIVRFVDTQNYPVEVKEHFLGYKTVVQCTGEELFNGLFGTFKENCVDFKDCRGQGFDNGANMTGKKKGVQSVVLKISPRASLVPCGCHSLNLVLSDAAASSTALSIHLFGVLQRVYGLFSASMQRWRILTDNVGGLTEKDVSPKRWESHIDSVKPIRYDTAAVYEALLELANCPQAEAGVRYEAKTLATQLTDYKFLLSLAVWYDLLFQVNIVTEAMQSRTMDIGETTSLFKLCLEYVKEYRNSGYWRAASAANEIAESTGAVAAFEEPSRKRARKRPLGCERSDDEFAESAEERFKKDFFYPLIDVVRVAIEERFKQFEAINGLWAFLQDLKGLSNLKELGDSCKKLHLALKIDGHADIDATELREELHYLAKIIPVTSKADPLSVLQFLKDTETVDVFPNVWVALRIFLTMPITVASADSTLSKSNLIKTYLRSTLGDDKLNSLAVLSIESNIAREIDFSEVINNFAIAKARKAPF